MAPADLTVPKLLPIAGTWAAPFTLYHLILSGRIVSQRIGSKVFIGDKFPSSSNQATSNLNEKSKASDLEIASRCHGNFLENVPLAFIFLIIAELNGGNRKYLHWTMATLLALRIAHADGGLRLQGKFGDNGVGRPLGYFGSCGVLMGLSGYAGWLCKGYWGF